MVARTLLMVLGVVLAVACLVVAGGGTQALAQTGSPAPAPNLERFDGVWVEGPGFDITYGATYAACAERCLGNAKCRMIEFYRPEKKCNLYDSVRPRLKGGASVVGVRKQATPR